MAINIPTKRFADLEEISSVANNDMLLIHNGNGVKKVTAKNLKQDVINSIASINETGNANVELANGISVGYTSKKSRYWISGNMCTVQFYLVFDGIVPETPTTLRLVNMPVPPSAASSPLFGNYLVFSDMKESGNTPSPQVGCVVQEGSLFKIMLSRGTDRAWWQGTTTLIKSNTTLAGVIIYKV